PYAFVQNARRKFIYPSSKSGSAAAAGVAMPADMRVSITNTGNGSGYPITGFTWLVVYRDAPRAAQLKRFLTWVVTQGQKAAEPLSYAPVPSAVTRRELGLI